MDHLGQLLDLGGARGTAPGVLMLAARVLWSVHA